MISSITVISHVTLNAHRHQKHIKAMSPDNILYLDDLRKPVTPHFYEQLHSAVTL